MRRLMPVLLLLAPLAAGAQTFVAPGAITWGLSATFPPFESVQDGKPAGFDIDLAALIAKKMAVTSNVTTYEFKGLIPALLGHRIDAIISGMYMSTERQQVVDFVPYLLVGNQIVVRQGNPLHVDGTAALCGHRVSAPVGTIFEVAANKVNAACTAAGKPPLTMLMLAGTTGSALALSQDRADAIIVSTPTAASLLAATPDAFETAGAPFDNDTKVGIAVGKDNAALLGAIDHAMHDVVADGSYAALLTRWKLPASASPF